MLPGSSACAAPPSPSPGRKVPEASQARQPQVFTELRRSACPGTVDTGGLALVLAVVSAPAKPGASLGRLEAQAPKAG